jgi:hypothetical protein
MQSIPTRALLRLPLATLLRVARSSQFPCSVYFELRMIGPLPVFHAEASVAGDDDFIAFALSALSLVRRALTQRKFQRKLKPFLKN